MVLQSIGNGRRNSDGRHQTVQENPVRIQRRSEWLHPQQIYDTRHTEGEEGTSTLSAMAKVDVEGPKSEVVHIW
jgi:hypothetical protein